MDASKRVILVIAIGLLASTVPASANQDPQLVCFGTEPFWTLSLESPETARFTRMDESPVSYRGDATRLEHLHERVWRGRSEGDAGGELVAFLRDAECRDGMSDDIHGVEARVSLPDGRFFAGCCRTVSSSAASPSSLEARDWRLVAQRGRDPQALARLSAAPSLRFEAGRLQGFGGCSALVGSFDKEGDLLTIGPLAGTLMACEPHIMEVETAFTQALTGRLRFEVTADRLTLAREAASEPELVFALAPPPRLEGVDWEVTGFNNGRQAVVSAREGTSIRLSFQSGSLVGHTGCNEFRARYTQTAGELSITEIATTTRKVCAGEGVMDQERELLAALATATVWTIDRRGMLDVHRADGERVLTADAAGASRGSR